MINIYLTIVIEAYKGIRNDLIACGISCDVIHQGNMYLFLKLYGITSVGYDAGVSGNKYVTIKSSTGFIEIPVDAVQSIDFR